MRRFPAAISGRKVRFALVGCGRISQNHIGAIAECAADAELTDICDIDAEALAKAKAATGARTWDGLDDLLEHSDADVVVVATPSGLHSEHAIKAADAGRHVMTEKPMATRWADGLSMIKACDDAGVRLFVVKQNRYNATLQLLKNAVTERRFGRIYMVNVNVFWTRPQSYYDSASWRGTWEFDGGAFMNQASHYVDLLHWLMGPVESIQAYTTTLARDIEVEDTGVASIRWRSGTLGSMNVTMLTYPRNLEGSITILGEKGTVRIGGIAVNRIDHWEFATPHPDDAQLEGAGRDTTSVYGFGHPPYYRNAIDVLTGRAEPGTDGREGLKTLELIVAIYRSARDGRRVNLPLDP